MTPEANRITFQLEAYVPPGKTARESVEWIQKFFDYYHPSLAVRVIYEGSEVKTPPLSPKTKSR